MGIDGYTNEHLKAVARDLGVADTCSNCLLYNRGTRCCGFDGAQVDNPNCMESYCKWWVPDKWMLKMARSKVPYKYVAVNYISNVGELKKIMDSERKQAGTISIDNTVVPYSGDEPGTDDGSEDTPGDGNSDEVMRWKRYMNNMVERLLGL